MKAQPLDRTTLLVDPKNDPRQVLAGWITDPKNEYFSGAIANRIWKHYLGIGLVEPVDDLRATNPPSNPQLWQGLKNHLVQNRFDLKSLMRVILNSRTYQLKSTTNVSNETDQRYYSHYYARRLPAEVLMDAISQVTAIPDLFNGYPEGIRAIQIPDPQVSSYFLSLFGRSNRISACACERSADVTMPQLLHLQNGEKIAQKIRDRQSFLSKLLEQKTDNVSIIDQLFLRTYARKAREGEKNSILPLLTNEDRKEVLSDLFWALLNSKNFAFNY